MLDEVEAELKPAVLYQCCSLAVKTGYDGHNEYDEYDGSFFFFLLDETKRSHTFQLQPSEQSCASLCPF